jgi:nucleotide-binding universal stress UspA family protein
MYHSILVPLDGSTFAEHAIPYARMLARLSDGGITLALVHETSPLVVPDVSAWADTERWESETREQEQTYVEAVATRLSADMKTDVKHVLLEGTSVAGALEEEAYESGVDLVVMTTHGRTGLARAWLGSVADSLARRLGTPLLLIRPTDDAISLGGEAVPFKRILVPLDGSPTAEAAVPHALRLAKLVNGAVTLLQVVVPPSTVMSAYIPQQTFLQAEELSEMQAGATAYLERTAASLKEPDLPPVSTDLALADSAARGILKHAIELGVSVIVMGTHARGTVGRTLLGSVADKVVRGSDVPVMVYRAS